VADSREHRRGDLGLAVESRTATAWQGYRVGKKVLIEVYLRGIDGDSPEAKGDTVVRMQEQFRREYPATRLVIMPFGAVEGARYSGGRQHGMTLEGLRQNAEAFNSRGNPMMITLNGGLLLEGQDDAIDLRNDPRLDRERELLTALSESGQRHGVANGVTIAMPSFERAVQECFPALRTIASCIRFYDRGRAEYPRALATSHAVTPTNQDIDYAVRTFPDRVRQLVLFLRFDCTSPRDVCRQHMMRDEAMAKAIERPHGDETREHFLARMEGNDLVDPSRREELYALLMARLACVKGEYSGHGERMKTLAVAVQRGAWQFKIALTSYQAVVHGERRGDLVPLEGIHDILGLVQAAQSEPFVT
jgi:hypothetical protein